MYRNSECDMYLLFGQLCFDLVPFKQAFMSMVLMNLPHNLIDQLCIYKRNLILIIDLFDSFVFVVYCALSRFVNHIVPCDLVTRVSL